MFQPYRWEFRLRSVCFGLIFVWFAPHPVAAQSPTQPPAQSRTLAEQICSSERVVFLGDSITFQGDYVALIDAYLQSHACGSPAPMVINVGLPSETVSGLSEEGHAGGKFPRPDLMERLVRVLDTTKPSFVFACYGMNCGIYQPVSADRMQAYRDGITRLRDELTQRGVPLVLMTPVVFDNQIAKAKGSFEYWQYDDTLTAYSEWLMSLNKQGQPVIDLHTCFSKQLQARREDDPSFTFQTDAVHPSLEGHEVIADCVVEWLRSHGVGSSDSIPSVADEKRLKLFQQKMRLLRDAYVAAAGHKRPGIKAGLPIDQAIEQANQLQEQINLSFSGSNTNP
ncbi:GDSL-like Lipase/Acylhydrolase [Neorhodopirellula pilleata]|uniref:GDSL-like Lipase/Acylhydrolase n=2 Tax=Neorhodopirellula pilleata TaxID=2714738 RepID=A0A5C5ZZ03_9BACT|nr:GDSL-like Lipase/Acylhydrolase [Neorhodopirellula pilleata]